MKKWHVIQIHKDTNRIIVVDSTDNRPQAMQDIQNINSLDVVSIETLARLKESGYTIVHF